MRISQCLCFILVGLTWLPTAVCTAAEPKATPPARQSAISTHMLNTSTGKPAAGVAVSLQRLNDDYEAKRLGGGLAPPSVRLVAPGTFEQWQRRHGKWGGQHKMPRCRSDRVIADELAGHAPSATN